MVIAELRGVTKRYGAVTALDGINLEICRGQLLALLGPNGAGKTTAVRLLLGLARPNSGQVADTTDQSPGPAAPTAVWTFFVAV